jgi:hypothetical protein
MEFIKRNTKMNDLDLTDELQKNLTSGINEAILTVREIMNDKTYTAETRLDAVTLLLGMVTYSEEK